MRNVSAHIFLHPTKFYKMIHDVNHQCSIGCTICSDSHRATFAVGRIYRAPLSDTNETSFNYSYIVLQSKAVLGYPIVPRRAKTIVDFLFFEYANTFIYTQNRVSRRIIIFSRLCVLLS